MNKETKLYFSIIILIFGISFHLAIYNTTKASENMDLETSSVVSDKLKEKEVIEQNRTSSEGAKNTEKEDSVGERVIARYNYRNLMDDGLVRDWEEKAYKEVVIAVRIWINSDGNVTKSEISKPSGYLELDKLVLESIKKRVFKRSNDGRATTGIIEFYFNGNELNK